MRTTRIELDGSAGYVHIQRRRGDSIFRIDSFVRYPKNGQLVCQIWTLNCHVGDEELLKVAAEVQQRTDGRPGSRSAIQQYFRILQLFQA